MGNKRAGLARIQNRLEKLKRELSMQGSTVKGLGSVVTKLSTRVSLADVDEGSGFYETSLTTNDSGTIFIGDGTDLPEMMYGITLPPAATSAGCIFTFIVSSDQDDTTIPMYIRTTGTDWELISPVPEIYGGMSVSSAEFLDGFRVYSGGEMDESDAPWGLVIVEPEETGVGMQATFRCDGTGWYYDGTGDDITYFYGMSGGK